MKDQIGKNANERRKVKRISTILGMVMCLPLIIGGLIFMPKTILIITTIIIFILGVILILAACFAD